MARTFKILLVFPEKKWRTQDSRVKSFQEYLSSPEVYGKIYGKIQIDTINIKLPELAFTSQLVYSEKDIKAITTQYRKDYSAIGIVFPFKAGEKYGGNYYPNEDKTDHVLDFYIKTNEKTSQRRRGQKLFAFEEHLEHEVSHAVALDVGLVGQYSAVGYKAGHDNTHFYFYNEKDLLTTWYKEINAQFDKKRAYFQTVINASKTLVDSLKKNSQGKPSDLLPLVKDKVATLIEVCDLLDMPIKIVSGYRSHEAQNALYSQGRTTKGNIVTNAKGGESMHNFGVAVDYAFVGSTPYPPITDKKWKLVNDMAEQLGFYSYGNSLKWDYGHLQLTLGYSEKDFRDGKVDYSRFQ